MRISSRLLRKSLAYTDERSKLEGELLGGIDVVKCSAWEVCSLLWQNKHAKEVQMQVSSICEGSTCNSGACSCCNVLTTKKTAHKMLSQVEVPSPMSFSLFETFVYLCRPPGRA